MKFRPRFTLRSLMVVVALAAVGFWWWQSLHPRGLQGTWQGLQEFKDFTFRFDGELLYVTNKIGTVATRYKLTRINNLPAIDFECADGVQYGLYQIDEERGILTMVVADLGAKRPSRLDSFGVVDLKEHFVYYVFQRSK